MTTDTSVSTSKWNQQRSERREENAAHASNQSCVLHRNQMRDRAHRLGLERRQRRGSGCQHVEHQGDRSYHRASLEVAVAELTIAFPSKVAVELKSFTQERPI